MHQDIRNNYCLRITIYRTGLAHDAGTVKTGTFAAIAYDSGLDSKDVPHAPYY